MSSKYSGKCLCGSISYSTEVDPVFSGNCHCKDCQKSSGSAFTPAMIFPEDKVLVSGEVKYYESTADSGNVHRRGFCPNCGSQLFSLFGNMLGMIGIKAGTLTNTPAYMPMLDFHVSSAAPWDFMNPDLPKKNGSASE